MSLSSSREQIKTMVRDAADIVQVIGEHVELKRSGSRFTGRCPFHNEKTPSFSVNPQGQFFHCFGCGEHGDVFSFVMKYHHMEFPEALKLLARKFGVDLPERPLSESEQARLRQLEKLYEANETAVLVYQQCLRHPKWGKPARAYLERRGVPTAAIERYRLGCAPDPEQAGWSYLTDQLMAKGLTPETLAQAGLAVRKEQGGQYDRFRSRIMFPIVDMTGRVVAFGGRILGDGQPKYMNSPESPIFDKSRLLFGLHQHREAIRKARRCLVVEGNFDLLLLSVHGIDNVVAPLGTALTRSHIHSLRGYSDEVILLFDADAAGLKAAMRSIPFFLAEGVEGRVALLPPGHDPDSFVREAGAEAVVELVDAARPLPEFAFDALVREHGLTLAGKNRIVSELKRLLAEAADAGQRELMIAHFSEKLGLAPGYFQVPSKAAVPLAKPAPAPITPQSASLSRQEKQVVDFLILYPEYHEELRAAGLTALFRDSTAAWVIELVEHISAAGPSQPEQLLTTIDNETIRAYIIQLLTQVPSGIEPESDHARRTCDELLQWLHQEQQRRDGAALQEQINLAQQHGNAELLMELLRRKQEIGKKRTGF
ncbi:DNA primase [Desulfobulbus propionicus DSM 2032]|uniref:DNA primase n=1 Tax=Desulfobulbus propionicus (strain ATCC 33891 / DSM 2032 / VKM B-1956 / 1pr3) TaxID=577650 RepID=A0A7U3YPA6_DESPD|nr:DNA primase [Desulfobulbus propionicus]ADW19068.1 DNA primase [Desulfobulbus propionicus DSM 2032]